MSENTANSIQPTPGTDSPMTSGTEKASTTTAGPSAKATARERLKTERTGEARRARIRRRLAVVGSALAVLGLAAGIGLAAGEAGGTSPTDAPGERPLKIPANTSGENGTVITYGPGTSENTLKIYEDPRCPYCALFEQANGETVRRLAAQGRFTVEYHFATFLDDGLGGEGSKRALAALGAAVNKSEDAFLDYHQVLYENHPAERDDAFASTTHLLDLASQVEGLRDPSFDAAVKNLTYLPWAQKVSADFAKSQVSGTPTVVLNDVKLPVVSARGAVTAQQFTNMVNKQLQVG